MKVKVEAEHIANGKEKNSQHCMIADAVKAACPSAQFIQVDLQTIRFSDPKKRRRLTYLTPAVAQHNLLRFDQGQSVKPFAFSLNTPVRDRAMQGNRGSEARKASAKKARKNYRKNQKKQNYAYLAANRQRNHQQEREFGLKKFVA